MSAQETAELHVVCGEITWSKKQGKWEKKVKNSISLAGGYSDIDVKRDQWTAGR